MSPAAFRKHLARAPARIGSFMISVHVVHISPWRRGNTLRGSRIMLIHGRCHCGNIAFTMTWAPDPVEIPARACGCSFCTKHGGVWTSNPAAVLEVRVTDPVRVSRYAFGTRTADFHICATCGIVPLVTSRVAGHLYAVVNVNTFTDVAPALLRHTAASFEEESEETRLARRARNWIAHVSGLS
jgi:hypothetical protein